MRLKGAIIGLGNVAVKGHLPEWKGCEQAQIVAAADALESRCAEAQGLLPMARFYTETEVLLASEPLDFLDICTPPGTHAPLARLALDRGLHVLCEKPLVVSLDELRLVRRAHAASGCVLHTVHNWLYAPIIQKATALIQEGQIGTVRHIRWQVLRCQPSVVVAPPLDSSIELPTDPTGDGRQPERGKAAPDNWRLDPAMAGGGILLDHGWHALYIILRWLGRDPIALAATLEKRAHPEWPVEDTATVQLCFPGAVTNIFLTWAAASRSNSIIIEGTRGTIWIDDDVLRLTGDTDTKSWRSGQPLSKGSHHPDWFSHVRDDFLRAILDETQRGKNLAEASRCVQLVHLAKKSHSRGGQPIAAA